MKKKSDWLFEPVEFDEQRSGTGKPVPYDKPHYL